MVGQGEPSNQIGSKKVSLARRDHRESPFHESLDARSHRRSLDQNRKASKPTPQDAGTLVSPQGTSSPSSGLVARADGVRSWHARERRHPAIEWNLFRFHRPPPPEPPQATWQPTPFSNATDHTQTPQQTCEPNYCRPRDKYKRNSFLIAPTKKEPRRTRALTVCICSSINNLFVLEL